MPEIRPFRLEDTCASHIHIWRTPKLLLGYSNQPMQVTPLRNICLLENQIVGSLNEFFGLWSLGDVSYNDFGAFCRSPFAELQVNA
jgi:hypothetical protein